MASKTFVTLFSVVTLLTFTSLAAGPRLPGIQAKFDKAPQPKELIILDGTAHAQYLFQTGQADRIMQETLRFLAKY